MGSTALLGGWLLFAAGLGAAGVGAEGKALARPTPEQAAWQDREIEMFLCLDPCTWQDKEYDDHSTPLSKIDPAKLDTDQWARVAVSLGAGRILFVAKHVGGFCWWQTGTSPYGVKETPWRGGKGDVVADLAASCRKHGLELGIYLVFEGVEAPQFVRRDASAASFTVSIAGIGRSMVLRASARTVGGAEARGEVLVRAKSFR